ncbi:hypothetical protein DVA76_18820, partial [Acinetobacter baumannii]
MDPKHLVKTYSINRLMKTKYINFTTSEWELAPESALRLSPFEQESSYRTQPGSPKRILQKQKSGGGTCLSETRDIKKTFQFSR